MPQPRSKIERILEVMEGAHVLESEPLMDYHNAMKVRNAVCFCRGRDIQAFQRVKAACKMYRLDVHLQPDGIQIANVKTMRSCLIEFSNVTKEKTNGT